MMRPTTKSQIDKLEKLLRYRAYGMDELCAALSVDRRTIFRWMTTIGKRGVTITRSLSRPTKYEAPPRMQGK